MDKTSYQITRTNSKDVDEILEARDIINLYYSDQATLSGPTKYKYLNKSSDSSFIFASLLILMNLRWMKALQIKLNSQKVFNKNESSIILLLNNLYDQT